MGQKRNKMNELLILNQKRYWIPVIDTINLTEVLPENVSHRKFSRKEIKGDKGFFIKRLFGLLSFIAAIVSFLLALYFKGSVIITLNYISLQSKKA